MKKKEAHGKENLFSSDPELENIEQDLAEINERLKRVDTPNEDVLSQEQLKQKTPAPSIPKVKLQAKCLYRDDTIMLSDDNKMLSVKRK